MNYKVVYQVVPPTFILLRLCIFPVNFRNYFIRMSVVIPYYLSSRASSEIFQSPVYELMASIWTGVFAGFIGAANALLKGYFINAVLMSSYHSSARPILDHVIRCFLLHAVMFTISEAAVVGFFLFCFVFFFRSKVFRRKLRFGCKVVLMAAVIESCFFVI